MRLSEDGTDVICSNPDCINSIRNHAWGRIKAEGWFFTRDESEAFCPEHAPEWYAEWRAKVQRGKI